MSSSEEVEFQMKRAKVMKSEKLVKIWTRQSLSLLRYQVLEIQVEGSHNRAEFQKLKDVI